MSITITPQGGDPVVITPIAGSLSLGGGHDDRGGGKIPNTRAGIARNGSFEALINDTTLTPAIASGLRTAAGGHADITGDMESYDALVDVEISGDAVQIAKFTVKGTTAPAT
ncbi:MAG: hypothetical protein PHP98_10550 [Kiritimatiellae bacterium]|nr:hypothetical protein [Kiritimatiellia bacterium]